MSNHLYLLEYGDAVLGIVEAPRNNRNAAIAAGHALFLLPAVFDDEISVYDAVDRVGKLDDIAEIEGAVNGFLRPLGYNLTSGWKALADYVRARGFSYTQIPLLLERAAARVEHLQIRDDVRYVFNCAIDDAESTNNLDRVARLEILREYFCNEPFRVTLHDLLFQLNYKPVIGEYPYEEPAADVDAVVPAEGSYLDK